MASPPRVLHVLGSLNPGGVEMWLLNVLGSVQPATSAGICTLGPRPGALEGRFAALGVEILRCPLTANLAGFARSFVGLLRQQRYSVVHSHVHLFSGLVLALARAAGVPIRIAHSHTSMDDKTGRPFRSAYRAMMAVLLRGSATHRLAASHAAGGALFGGNGDAYDVIHYGIDLSIFSVSRNASLRGQLGLPSEAIVVGHVGRLVEAKNQEFLLHVWREFVRLEPSSRLVIVGDGPLRPRLEGLAATLGLAGSVLFLGVRDDVPSLLSSAFDVMVLPSLWEGLPVATVEAQAAGLPVLVSDRVSAEIAVIPSLVRHLGLDEGPRAWAEALAQHLRAVRPTASQALAAVCGSSFDSRVAGSLLKDYYLAALAALPAERTQ